MYPYPNNQPISIGDEALPNLQDMRALRRLRARILLHDTFFRRLLNKSPILDYFIHNTWNPFFKDWQKIDQYLVYESRPEVMRGLAHYLSIVRDLAASYSLPVPYE